ncbi:MAG: SDR family oxidoreductase [Pseudomonadota bacterium]
MFRQDLLAGKRLAITGGGSGLGRAMAQRFLELGAEVVICGRREEVLAETAEALGAETGGPITWHVCDIRDPQSVEDFVAWLWQGGAPDGLVNNAAGNILARSQDLSHRAFDAVVNIVLKGTAYMTLACGKRWIAEQRPANVLSIVTSYAWTGSGYVLPSAMAKAGVLAMTQSLAAEWGPHGIRLNAIAPGPFPTPGAWDRLLPMDKLRDEITKRIPLGRVGEHRELADLATYLLADGSGYVTGDVVTIDGGEWLKGAGQFTWVGDLMDEEDWAAIKPKKKG